MKRPPRYSGVPLALTLILVASSCRDTALPPLSPEVRTASWGTEMPANFRLTGGGRIDKPYPQTGKNTPDSHDFSTFGFQARPLGPNTVEGRGNITWEYHNPEAWGGGWTFHGDVDEFYATDDPNCGSFEGVGSVKSRDGQRVDGAHFIVETACDYGEPGVGHDVIRILFDGPTYLTGILTGGNIQKHKL